MVFPVEGNFLSSLPELPPPPYCLAAGSSSFEISDPLPSAPPRYLDSPTSHTHVEPEESIAPYTSQSEDIERAQRVTLDSLASRPIPQKQGLCNFGELCFAILCVFIFIFLFAGVPIILYFATDVFDNLQPGDGSNDNDDWWIS